MQRSILQHVEAKNIRQDVATFRTGDTVRVHWKVKEGEKERVQPFEGIVIRKTNGQNRATFTVRKVSYGVGVERIFPLHSPRYERIEVLTRSHVGRSRLFYLRNLRGKASRIQSEDVQQPPAVAARAAPTEASASAPPSGEAGAPEAEKPAAAPKAKKAKPAAKAPKKKE